MDVLRIPVDKYFKIGVAFLIIGFVIFILNNFGQIPTSFISQNSSKFGTGVEVIFLSLSMANLIGILKSEREEFNRLALERSEEMNEMKTYFLSNISHELRTPLNAIMNLSTNIITSTIDEDARSNAKVIKTSSHTLLSSVNDILDFSKIEKRELKLENQNFKPGDILKLIRKASEIRAADAGLVFEFQQKGTLPELICGDANRLCQIINNIISNAIKFTPEGAVTVQCESIQKPQNKVQFALTITDTGIGISKDKLRNIFEAFTQNNINNKRQYGGLGLGLYISKTLVDLMNGSIYIKSTLGKGTVCRIAVEYDVVEVPIATNATDNSQFNLRGARILVVEDNAINQMVIKMITKKWLNTEVVYTANGLEGINTLKTQQFDIVLMDLQMPVMDGYEATIAIRKGDAGADKINIPIIAVTADVMEATKQTVKDIGMNDYLSKPLNNETLFAAVNLLVSNNTLKV
jgi:signal transduction histidine kinase/ActR/RegA family two-component response regulator